MLYLIDGSNSNEKKNKNQTSKGHLNGKPTKQNKINKNAGLSNKKCFWLCNNNREEETYKQFFTRGMHKSINCINDPYVTMCMH